MKIVKMFFVSVCLVFVSYSAFAANYCLNCFDQIDETEKYCVVCKAKLSVDELKTKEEQLIHAVTVSRKNYRAALDELRQYYQDTGNQLRLQKTRRELDALDKVPQPLYTDEGLGNVRTGVTLRDIEDANTLFNDAMMYKKSFSKENRITAIKRLEKLMAAYPDSDKVGDAAFEIAEIYAGSYFHDYESAAKYYIKSYQLNPYIKQPALLRAAETYDKMLTDYERAKAIYQQAALYSPDAKSRKKAQDRLSVLEQGTAGKK
ncbi:MAG TPA: tetratricopeptide repeat protein [Candidatus Wunengus sp. YC60]|uniref:tetratricopeptide repeat protein n=1 Tax=Candidatus Wunengus sp. YC60 TaxID=3367697 RepID=UPI004027C25B